MEDLVLLGHALEDLVLLGHALEDLVLETALGDLVLVERACSHIFAKPVMHPASEDLVLLRRAWEHKCAVALQWQGLELAWATIVQDVIAKRVHTHRFVPSAVGSERS